MIDTIVIISLTLALVISVWYGQQKSARIERDRARQAQMTDEYAQQVRGEKVARLDARYEVDSAEEALERERSARRAAEADLAAALRAPPRDDWERRFWETHALVARVLEERDEWQQRFYAQGAAHLEGQAMLEHAITNLRTQRAQLVELLNATRKKLDPDAKPIADRAELAKLTGPPLGQAADYLEHLKKLSAEAQAWAEQGAGELDHSARETRDEIASSAPAKDRRAFDATIPPGFSASCED